MASKTKIIINLKTGKRVVKDARKHYGFHSFCDPGSAPYCDFSGTFCDIIREFVKKCGEIEDWNVEGYPTWCTLLVDEKRSSGGGGGGGGGADGGGFVIPLYTIEESVENSSKPYCTSCQSVGWSHHLVSKRRYHFIIPADDGWQKSPCKTIFGHQTHLLHGIIHCNGFGHLLRINGLEGGSKFLTGRDIMDLWDRLCTALGARKIAVYDVSIRRSMDLRLLYGVAYGHPWFGEWGYEFYNGSFGITAHDYSTAISKLGSLNLDNVVEHSDSKDRNHLEKIIRTYREMTTDPLITVRELLCFMLITHHALPKPHSVIKPITGSVRHISPFQGVNSNSGNRWNKNIDRNGSTPGLDVYDDILYLYKDLLLQGYDGRTISESSESSSRTVLDSKHFVKEWTFKDEERLLRFVCRLKLRQVSHGYEDESCSLSPDEFVVVPVHTTIGELKKKVECTFRDTYCLLEHFRVTEIEGLSEIQDEDVLPGSVKPGAIIWVLGDGHEGSDQLKYQGGAETWTVNCSCGAKDDDGERMVACDICSSWQHTRCSGIDDVDPVLGSFLCVDCSTIADEFSAILGETDNSWIVDCVCGAEDDDGERMVACDICDVWLHTRCVGINDADAVPEKLFVCSRCEASLNLV
ncbi:hypothetical protein MKW94_024072 [Papaver nudicaule]|uniref:PHD-type domain-containing protein n=1 Tax=Papaver nudicaule TaxID=74823 RepID=A0AA41S153_PAPNU|nr:hypothetical protein [Papaver nudicaule]